MLRTLMSKVDKLYDYFGQYFVTVIFTFHVIYFAVIFGIVSFNMAYLNTFNIVIHILVCLFLIFRFNPLREKNHLKPHDSDIIFSSSLFLLLNLGVLEFIKKYLPEYAVTLGHSKSLLSMGH